MKLKIVLGLVATTVLVVAIAVISGGLLLQQRSSGGSSTPEPLRPCLAQMATTEAEGQLSDEGPDYERLDAAEKRAQLILDDPSKLKGSERALVSFEKKMNLSEALAVVSEIAPEARVSAVGYDLLDGCNMRHTIGIGIGKGEDPEEKVESFLPAELQNAREMAGNMLGDPLVTTPETNDPEEVFGYDVANDSLLAQNDIRDDQARLRGFTLELSTDDLLALLEARHENGIAAVEVIGAHPTMMSPIIVGED